jgi:hypothetical protein
MQLRANPHCGKVYREKVRARKNEIVWDSKKLSTQIGNSLNYGKPTITI